MEALFSVAGRRRLDEFARPGLLCAFDFDGTLAPIVPRPEQARLPDAIRGQLVQLSELAPVAVITGRSLADIRGRLGFEPDFIVGNHGLEGVPGWEANAARHRALCDGWREQLARALPKLQDPGILVEDKRYSLSLHYRRACNADAASRLAGLFRLLQPPPRVVPGKQVFNLVPPDAPHKGAALQQLMKAHGASRALYAGDDVTDEDAFRLPRREVLSIRIEHAPHSAAEFFLAHPQDVALLLSELLSRLRLAARKDLEYPEIAMSPFDSA
ncbi:MAG TPA: trehalose-phosphatase [Noviherbaspirillum sp.]|nr:trehalose-phosphatase [Noviherbaspirillum sp.]